MIDIQAYRISIGVFNLTSVLHRFFKSRKYFSKNNRKKGSICFSVLFISSLASLLISSWSLKNYNKKKDLNLLPSLATGHRGQFCSQYSVVYSRIWSPVLLGQNFKILGKKCSVNFQARYLHGNIGRGMKNVHINIRSLFNKISEVKSFVSKEKPHIIGISEAELFKSHHNLEVLKIPGYDLLMPKSWDLMGRAQIVVYIKKGVVYQHIHDLEECDVQSLWIKAGFKNCKTVYYCHLYREHTNSLG